MATDREWDVFDDSPYPCRVTASSASEAREMTAMRFRPDGVLRAHRVGCACSGPERQPCMLAHVEDRLKGTPLGRLARL